MSATTAQTRTERFLAKAIVAVPLGCFVGLILECVFFWDGPYSILRVMNVEWSWSLWRFRTNPPMMGALLGMSAAVGLSSCFANWNLATFARPALYGLGAGISVAILYSLFIYPGTRATSTAVGGASFSMSYRATPAHAFPFALPIGAFLGTLVGVVVYVVRIVRTGQKPLTPPQHGD